MQKKIFLTNLIILIILNLIYIYTYPDSVGKWYIELLIRGLFILFYLIGFNLITKSDILQNNNFYKLTTIFNLTLATLFLIFFREVELFFNKTSLYVLYFPLAPYIIFLFLGFIFLFLAMWNFKKSGNMAIKKMSFLTGYTLIIGSLLYLILNISFLFHGGYIRLWHVSFIAYFIILGTLLVNNFKSSKI